jgi:lactam utilization protein B
VIYQIGALQALAHVAGSSVTYVKPHGALYNTIVNNPIQARAVAEAVHAVDPSCPCSGWPVGVLRRGASASGMRTVPEAFADRRTGPTGSWCPGASATPCCTTRRDRRPGGLDGAVGAASSPSTGRRFPSPSNRLRTR